MEVFQSFVYLAMLLVYEKIRMPNCKAATHIRFPKITIRNTSSLLLHKQQKVYNIHIQKLTIGTMQLCTIRKIA